MTEDNGTKGPTGAPPSFIPASGRKRQSDSSLTGSSHRPNELRSVLTPQSRFNRGNGETRVPEFSDISAAELHAHLGIIGKGTPSESIT